MQKTWVQSLAGEIRTHVPQSNQTHAPRLLSPHTTAPGACTLECLLCSERSPCSAQPRQHNEEQSLLIATKESWHTAMKYSQKNFKKIIFSQFWRL